MKSNLAEPLLSSAPVRKQTESEAGRKLFIACACCFAVVSALVCMAIGHLAASLVGSSDDLIVGTDTKLLLLPSSPAESRTGALGRPAAVFLLGSVFAMLVALVGLNVVNVAAALAVGVASDLSHRRIRGGR